IELLKPDVNTSEIDFTEEHGKIRFGLSAVKNVGTAAIESLLSSRNADGRFSSFQDIIMRVDLSKVNKKTFESLIKAGAMDAFGTRSAMLSSLSSFVDQIHKKRRSIGAGQKGLFDDDESDGSPGIFVDALAETPELSKKELLAFEKELLGFYLTAHPLQSVVHILAEMHATPLSEISERSIGQRLTVGGIVAHVKKITTKAGNNEMAFVRIEDMSGSLEVVVFPKIYARTVDVWTIDQIVRVSGRIDEKEDRLTLLADEGSRLEKTD
ncbi:MAG: OB-fold nucleic acid binding domain-containing protein, partial [bacterium]|nr:OB-fold nucleic acid binding domain-containing protein [bacterium]